MVNVTRVSHPRTQAFFQHRLLPYEKVESRLFGQCKDVSFGSIAPGQHTAKQSLGDGQIPLAALRGRADLLESPGAMTAFGSSSHWSC